MTHCHIPEDLDSQNSYQDSLIFKNSILIILAMCLFPVNLQT